ncbi:MAG: hypothetical protein IJN96_00225 [Clostridia bacterium]|nr:hypothetical protein [Clostridia bacterium]
MSKITIIGAGKTGRGFVGRLMAEAGVFVQYIDKDSELVDRMTEKGSFDVNFFGNVREKITVSDFEITNWENADFSDTELIFVSVCGPNLKDVGAELKKRLKSDRHYYIITCENASKPSKTLKDAIDLPNVSVSEATVFCTTIEDGRLDINSENYPYLQCDAELLEGYIPEIKSVKPVENFGNFLTRKLFTYNAASCIIAYLGWKKGYTDYGQAANDEEILELLDKNYEITNRVLCKEFGYDEKDQAEFALLSRNKFTDTTIVDTVARNARQPQRKLGKAERIIGPMLVIDKYGEDTSVLEQTAAVMLMYTNDGEEEWDEIRNSNTTGEILEKICGLEKGSKLYNGILEYYNKMS